MADEVGTQEVKKGVATPSKGTLQSYIQNFTKEAIDQVLDIMHNSRNEALRFGAAKLIIDKSIPDVKAIEHTGENGGDILIRIIKDSQYIISDGNSTGDTKLSETGEHI